MPSGCAGLLLTLALGRVFDPSEASPSGLDEDDSNDALVTDYEAAIRGQAPIEVLPRRRWIRHRVRPRERLTQIAARYGVLLSDLVEWNNLDPNEPTPPRRLRSLRVLTDRSVPGRLEVRYRAAPGEGWGDIAAKFRVEQPDLRAWNWRHRRPSPDAVLVLWVDPGIPRTISPGQGPAIPETFDVPAGGVSVGRPDRGKLERGVQLPPSELYSRGYPGGLYGSSQTIEVVQRAMAHFRHDTGYEGEIVIGAISRQRGRRFPPHVSHQSGRDIDIRLPLLPGVPAHHDPNPDEIDWAATWGLVRAFVDTERVSIIFLDVDLQRRLYEAARVMGESHESLREVISWPSWKNKRRPIVRHAKGHDGHLHVRVGCAPGAIEPKCR
jgi:hypothetical protein